MERITVAVDDTLAAAFDELIGKRGYTSRSEAVRELMRREVDAARTSGPAKGQCVATLSYVYAHHLRDLAERINAAQHDHHELVISSSHVHLDHEHCLESVFLKGRLADVRAFAEQLGAQRGVQHCQLNLVAVDLGDGHRPPGRYHHHHGHLHLVPRS